MASRPTASNLARKRSAPALAIACGTAGGGRHFGQDTLSAQLQAEVQAAQHGRVEGQRDDVRQLPAGPAAANRRLLDLDLGRELHGRLRIGHQRWGLGVVAGGGAGAASDWAACAACGSRAASSERWACAGAPACDADCPGCGVEPGVRGVAAVTRLLRHRGLTGRLRLTGHRRLSPAAEACPGTAG